MGAPGKKRIDETFADPRVGDLTGGGGVIIVALIIGGAILAALFLFWESRRGAARQREIAAFEEEAYRGHRDAYKRLVAGDPGGALAKIEETRRKTDRISALTSRKDHRLRIVNNLLAAEANFILGGTERLTAALDEVGQGMALMVQSGGGLWEWLYFVRGRIHYELGDYGQAISDFNILLDYNPGYAAAFYWRSLAHAAKGDDGNAEADARKADRLGAWPPEKDFRQAYRARLASAAK
ncbi:MAG: tetratricopeptide repeat protein [Planctomycetota bacterium]|jgi:tetratricopeptide (TPR) repeat protein|nr:tetratricopeptide repeat protein [Planctomycetota bacterium]